MYSALVTRMRRIVLTAAVVPLVVLIGLRSAWASFACSMTGEVLAECCCPKKPDRERAPLDGAPRVEASCCCDVTFTELSKGSDVRESDRSRTLDAPMIPIEAGLPVNVVPRGVVASTRSELARPPPRDVPTYLVNRTILR